VTASTASLRGMCDEEVCGGIRGGMCDVTASTASFKSLSSHAPK
jgi:hypothetical protein